MMPTPGPQDTRTAAQYAALARDAYQLAASHSSDAWNEGTAVHLDIAEATLWATLAVAAALTGGEL
jgi:hypothetical protein